VSTDHRNDVHVEPSAKTARLIPDDLARELCEALNLWDGGYFNIDEDELVDNWLAPVIAKHLDAIAPLRECCATRRGQRHVTDCPALAEAWKDGAFL
jgi:hypothetical protein